jgi:hypothetical protein
MIWRFLHIYYIVRHDKSECTKHLGAREIRVLLQISAGVTQSTYSIGECIQTQSKRKIPHQASKRVRKKIQIDKFQTTTQLPWNLQK